jgi:two-component system sensor histidine kinase VicK
LTTYSDSKSIVSSYISIFENFWKQTELYEQLEESNKQLAEANEQLKVHNKLQDDFINIAAHELRTPIQPILSLPDILSSRIRHTGSVGAGEGQEILDVTTRNAKRLQRLTEKERFDLNGSNAIRNYRNEIEKDNRGIKLLDSHSKQDM